MSNIEEGRVYERLIYWLDEYKAAYERGEHGYNIDFDIRYNLSHYRNEAKELIPYGCSIDYTDCLGRKWILRHQKTSGDVTTVFVQPDRRKDKWEHGPTATDLKSIDAWARKEGIPI